MSKELITMEALTVAQKSSFKDARLANATNKIVKLYSEAATYVEKKNREFAAILSTVKAEKSYEKDGFKSVADYANTVFGISRSNAYALASAGDVYNDAKAPAEIKALSPSKLAELVNVPTDKLAEDIKAGTISVETTQKDLREYAKTAAPQSEDKPTVLPQFTARLVSMAVPDSLATILDNVHIMEDWKETISQYMKDTYTPRRAPEIIKLPKCAPEHSPTQDKKPISRYLFITENASLAFEFYEKTVEKPKGKGKDKKPAYSIEELEAMLAAAKAANENHGSAG